MGLSFEEKGGQETYLLEWPLHGAYQMDEHFLLEEIATLLR